MFEETPHDTVAPPCAPAAAPVVVPAAGRTPAARYRLGEMIARGGTSAVHRGWDRRLKRPVAVKLISSGEAPGPADREARLAANMDHPGLVPVYDVDQLDGREAVVMPLIEGPSLAHRLVDAEPLTVDETLRIGAELAGGLAYVHAHGVVHRDVKPSNVLLGRRGARLTDFGIAQVPGTTTITGDGLVLGTAAYLAPEQIRGGDVGPPADVFALGLVLIECLTGRSCYSSVPADCAARLERAPELPDDVDPWVASVLTELTRLDAGERPTADAAARRLERLRATSSDDAPAASATPDTSVTSPVAEPATAGLWRVPATAVAVAALVFVAVAIAVLALVRGRPDVAIPVVLGAVAALGSAVCFAATQADEHKWGT